MSKHRLLHILVVALVTVLVTSAVATSAQDDPVRLTFWDMSWGAQPAYNDTAMALVDRFNEEHPNIQVEYVSIPFDNWYQTFLTAVGSGTAPDVSTGPSFLPFQFYEMGAIAPLDDVIAEMQADGVEWQPGVLEAVNYDGHYIGVPWSLGARAWFYRKSMLEEAGIEPPTTWDEFRDAAIALTGDGRYGVVASGDTGGTQYIYNLINNNAGGLFTQCGEPDFMNERNLEAFEFYGDLAQAGALHPATPGYRLAEAAAAWAAGDAAFVLEGPGLVNRFPDIRDDIGILPPLEGPHGDVGGFRAINSIMLYTQSEHPEESREFIRWWADNQLPLWIEGRVSGNFPARVDFVADPHFQDNELLAYIIENYLPIASHIGAQYPAMFPALNEIEGEGFMQTLVQDLAQGKPVEPAVEQAAARFNEITRRLNLCPEATS